MPHRAQWNSDAYRLQVQLPTTKALLRVDTAASGLYLRRAPAEANGLKPVENEVELRNRVLRTVKPD